MSYDCSSFNFTSSNANGYMTKFIGADQFCVLESVRPNVRTPLARNGTLVQKNDQKGLFFEVFYKIKGVKFEISTRIEKPENKVSRNMFCVR